MITILHNQNLTDEDLSATMCLLEQTLNARPLTAVSDNPDELTALTTNHSLRGQDVASVAFLISGKRWQDLGKSIKTAQAYADMLWKRWNRESIPQLCNQWSKWSKVDRRILKEAELVCLDDRRISEAKQIQKRRFIQVIKAKVASYGQQESKWHKVNPIGRY